MGVASGYGCKEVYIIYISSYYLSLYTLLVFVRFFAAASLLFVHFYNVSL